MKRISLSDGSGKWFDADKATRWTDSTYWNGSNRIHRSTGSQWAGEWLFRTAGGRWILNEWSAYEKTPEVYEEIEESDAVRWLAFHEHQVPEVADQIAALEV